MFVCWFVVSMEHWCQCQCLGRRIRQGLSPRLARQRKQWSSRFGCAQSGWRTRVARCDNMSMLWALVHHSHHQPTKLQIMQIDIIVQIFALLPSLRHPQNECTFQFKLSTTTTTAMMFKSKGNLWIGCRRMMTGGLLNPLAIKGMIMMGRNECANQNGSSN